MQSFIYTRLTEVKNDEEADLAAAFADPRDNPMTDVVAVLQQSKTVIEPDEDEDEGGGHDCPIAWLYVGLVDAR